MDRAQLAHFEAFGFVVLRAAIAPATLRAELLGTLDQHSARAVATGVANVRYAPMMGLRTPTSLALLDQLEPFAAALLGGPVLPVRAKGMRYLGGTAWHTDSTRPLPSVGFAAYLEALDGNNGALRVLPGSQRTEYGQALEDLRSSSAGAFAAEDLPGVALCTVPGDLIAFDEHLYHASSGGTERLQWRVDYVRSPSSDQEEHELRGYFAQIFPADWDGGYDPDLSPSYDADWLASGRPSVEPLRRLGVYELARTQEQFMREQR